MSAIIPMAAQAITTAILTIIQAILAMADIPLTIIATITTATHTITTAITEALITIQAITTATHTLTITAIDTITAMAGILLMAIPHFSLSITQGRESTGVSGSVNALFLN